MKVGSAFPPAFVAASSSCVCLSASFFPRATEKPVPGRRAQTIKWYILVVGGEIRFLPICAASFCFLLSRAKWQYFCASQGDLPLHKQPSWKIYVRKRALKSGGILLQPAARHVWSATNAKTSDPVSPSSIQPRLLPLPKCCGQQTGNRQF